MSDEKKAKGRGPIAVQSAAPGAAGSQNYLLIAILLVGVVVAGAWYWMRSAELARMRQAKSEAQVARAPGGDPQEGGRVQAPEGAPGAQDQPDHELKKKQSVPVHILDQISRHLPDFLWLVSMTAASNQVAIVGKATTYNAVSNFYDNLLASGQFTDVVLGKTSEVRARGRLLQSAVQVRAAVRGRAAGTGSGCVAMWKHVSAAMHAHDG